MSTFLDGLTEALERHLARQSPDDWEPLDLLKHLWKAVLTWVAYTAIALLVALLTALSTDAAAQPGTIPGLVNQVVTWIGTGATLISAFCFFGALVHSSVFYLIARRYKDN